MIKDQDYFDSKIKSLIFDDPTYETITHIKSGDSAIHKEFFLELCNGSTTTPTISIGTYFGDDYVKAIGDKIASMSEEEAKELQDYLKEKRL